MHRPLPIGIICFVLVGAGCSSSPTDVEAPISEQNLRGIGQAYIRFTEEKNRPPASVKDLQGSLKGDVDKIFRSENDGEDFVILWGVDHRPLVKSGKGMPVIAYEKTGRSGKRLVLRGPTIVHLSSEEFQKAPFPPGHKAP